jgi:SSS family solute:Na+ symporter
VVGILSKRAPAAAASVAMVGGVALILIGYFVLPLVPALDIVAKIGQYHFLGIVFLLLVAVMLAFRWISPRAEPWKQEHSGEVDITPWKWRWPCAAALLAVVIAIYAAFADFSVLKS